MKAQFQVVLDVAEEGSYAVPWSVADGRSSPTLPLQVTGDQIETDTRSLFRSIAQGDDGWLQATVTDGWLQRRLLAEAEKLLPSPGSLYSIEFAKGLDKVVVDSSARHTLRVWQERMTEEPETVRQTFTGQLTEMKFDRRVITVTDPIQKREVECFYLDDVEPMLTTARRQLVQITGVFTVGADGFPTKVTDVIRIEALNLDPIHIDVITCMHGEVPLAEGLVFSPQLDDETGQLLTVDDDRCGIHVAAGTRGELVDEIRATLGFLVDEYVFKDEPLTRRAAALRERLKEIVGDA